MENENKKKGFGSNETEEIFEDIGCVEYTDEELLELIQKEIPSVSELEAEHRIDNALVDLMVDTLDLQTRIDGGPCNKTDVENAVLDTLIEMASIDGCNKTLDYEINRCIEFATEELEEATALMPKAMNEVLAEEERKMNSSFNTMWNNSSMAKKYLFDAIAIIMKFDIDDCSPELALSFLKCFKETGSFEDLLKAYLSLMLFDMGNA